MRERQWLVNRRKHYQLLEKMMNLCLITQDQPIIMQGQNKEVTQVQGKLVFQKMKRM